MTSGDFIRSMTDDDITENLTPGICELIKHRDPERCQNREHCSCIGIKQFSAGKAIQCTAESCKNKSEPSCGSCKWYAEPKGVCVNDQSKHVADFVWDERDCKEWEKKDNE